MKINEQIIILFLGIILFWFFICNKYKNESFDAKSVEFVPVGEARYGLRGDLIRTGDIAQHYINPERQIALHPSSEIMWESDYAPHEEGIKGCNKVNCPVNPSFDKMDSCWQCGTLNQKPTSIPDIWSHT
jgi:hypothetical protein